MSQRCYFFSAWSAPAVRLAILHYFIPPTTVFPGKLLALWLYRLGLHWAYPNLWLVVCCCCWSKGLYIYIYIYIYLYIIIYIYYIYIHIYIFIYTVFDQIDSSPFHHQLPYKPISQTHFDFVRQQSFTESKMLCWLAVGVPNPHV